MEIKSIGHIMRLRLAILVLFLTMPALGQEDILYKASTDPIFVVHHINWRRCVAMHYYDQLIKTKGYYADPDEAIEECDAEWTKMVLRIRELNSEAIFRALSIRIREDAKRSFPEVYSPYQLVDRDRRHER
jgi:hypothetical protein